MSTILYHSNFLKRYKKRIKSVPHLHQKFIRRIKIFSYSPSELILRDHALKGRLKGYRAFSITGNIRIIYRYVDKEKKKVLLIDVGTHTQIY